MTDHQASVISNFLRISYNRSKELINIRITWVKSIVIGLKYNQVLTSFKKGKITKVEAASQDRRKSRIAIWESGRGVYFLSDPSVLLVVLVVVGEPDNILDGAWMKWHCEVSWWVYIRRIPSSLQGGTVWDIWRPATNPPWTSCSSNPIIYTVGEVWTYSKYLQSLPSGFW